MIKNSLLKDIEKCGKIIDYNCNMDINKCTNCKFFKICKLELRLEERLVNYEKNNKVK